MFALVGLRGMLNEHRKMSICFYDSMTMQCIRMPLRCAAGVESKLGANTDLLDQLHLHILNTQHHITSQSSAVLSRMVILYVHVCMFFFPSKYLLYMPSSKDSRVKTMLINNRLVRANVF